ncbi:MAG: GTP-binding protein [Candidatus Woesearchaeota archaeon]
MEPEEQIRELEAELSRTKYNKATEFHFAVVRAKIAKLRRKIEARGRSRQKSGFSIKKTGDATAVFVGFPSVGKSSILNKLTGAHSKIAAYDFTTLNVIPGTLVHNGARIQLLDIPGILCGAATGSGRGKEVLSVVRNCDLLIIVIDALRPEHYQIILNELKEVGIRANEAPPRIKITKKVRGGITINSTVEMELSETSIKAALQEFGIANADVQIDERITLDRLIDGLEGNKVYIPAITVVNKIDLVDEKRLAELAEMLKPDLMISAENGTNIERLKEMIFERLKILRIFLKEVGKEPDIDEPMILRKPATLRDVCNRIHRELERKFSFARIWGKSARFPGQTFRRLDKELEDGDIIELHSR